MSETTSSLEREAEETRARIADTAESLRSKMTPGQMMDEVASMFRGGDGQAALVNLKNQVRDNPLPLAMVGIGLAWLALGKGTSVSTSSFSGYGRGSTYGSSDYSGARPPSGAAYAGSYDETGFDEGDYAETGYGDAEAGNYPYGGSSDYNAGRSTGSSSSSGGPGFVKRAARAAAGAWDSTTSAVGGAAGSVGDTLSGVGETLSGVGASTAKAGSRAARGTAGFSSRAYRGTAYKAQNLAGSASDLMNREPLVTAALGLAVGAFVGTLLPKTQTEDEKLGPIRDNLKDQAKNFATESFNQVKEAAADVATEAYAAAKGEADKQGLNPAGVEVSELHLADRVSSVIKTAAKAGEDAARERLNKDAGQSDDGEKGQQGTSSQGSQI
jgi:hypothetical protein